MFDKSYIKRGDEINFTGHGLMTVIDITKEEIIVGKNCYMKKGARLDSLRVIRINGCLHSKGILHDVYGV